MSLVYPHQNGHRSHIPCKKASRCRSGIPRKKASLRATHSLQIMWHSGIPRKKASLRATHSLQIILRETPSLSLSQGPRPPTPIRRDKFYALQKVFVLIRNTLALSITRSLHCFDLLVSGQSLVADYFTEDTLAPVVTRSGHFFGFGTMLLLPCITRISLVQAPL